MSALKVRNTRIAVSLDEPGAYAAMEAIVGSSDGTHVVHLANSWTCTVFLFRHALISNMKPYDSYGVITYTHLYAPRITCTISF